MNKKITAGIFMMLVVFISTLSYSIAQPAQPGLPVDSYTADPVGTVGTSISPKYVYGFVDVSEATISKYKAHCTSVNGVFNTCGSMCPEGEICPSVCAYTCENVRIKEEPTGDYKIIDKSGAVEVDYNADDSYNIRYYGGYNFDTDLEVKSASNGQIKVETAEGSVETVKVHPEDAIKNAFGPETKEAEIKLEEKNYNNIPTVIYNIESEKEGKFLGIFKIQARYQAAIDANTGDVLDYHGPWWAFLITGEPSEPVIKEKKIIEDKDELSDDSAVVDFKTCLDAGYPVMESYPRQCRYKDSIFVEII